MPGTLTFKLADLEPLAHHAITAPSRTPHFDNLSDPKHHKGGVVKLNKAGWPDASNIDLNKVKPALTLAKSNGVYLMSNGATPMPKVLKAVYALEWGSPRFQCNK